VDGLAGLTAARLGNPDVVWTGRQMSIWGGGKNYADGAAYTPAAP
jgi:hypothetical protein